MRAFVIVANLFLNSYIIIIDVRLELVIKAFYLRQALWVELVGFYLYFYPSLISYEVLSTIAAKFQRQNQHGL